MNIEQRTVERGDEIEDLSIEDLRVRYRELKAENDRLREEATIDPLTGVYNRRGLRDIAGKLFPKRRAENEQRTESKHKANAVLILDLDNFKIVNDTYGHLAGDQVLQAVVAYLKKNIRPEDIIARYGGEEFVVIFRNADAQDIINKFYDEDRADIRIPVEINGEKMNVTVSGGVTDWIEGEDIKDAIDRADKTLYQAKESGRDRIEKTEPTG